ncbi:hypothetical protein K504DRAFT_168136 [Pleomassaria siparia CBS 279.74]|uniref:Uncharacterized protein n=1 Tax=Pleomassaria siparia CBS 279.74 TaxID=1314801 RepID=A0A6G1JUL1_9PLEO|nr:hypothetical protein K504DRAFT_168136 [Pleomassaria siparia CBS 279.74]
MRRCFIPRQWRWPSIIWGLLVLELPFTVANMSLFGIASPNLYRTILWKEGGVLGFNSDPTTVLYAAANYRPVKIPLVWSSFAKKRWMASQEAIANKLSSSNTQYNLVIGVLCMFFYLIKCTGWLLHCLWPIFSLPLHLALLAVWVVSLYVQTAPDTIDPKRENKGAPWYITKSCDLASEPLVKKYCMQAKASFAVSVVMLAIYAIHVLLALFSLLRPTRTARTTHAEKVAHKRAEKEKWAALQASPSDNEMTAEQQWQHMWELQQLPRTPGTVGAMKSPMTPRSQAFGHLDGTSPPEQHGWYAQHQLQPQQQQQQQQHQQQQYVQQDNYGLGVNHGTRPPHGTQGDVSPVDELDEYVPHRQTNPY